MRLPRLNVCRSCGKLHHITNSRVVAVANEPKELPEKDKEKKGVSYKPKSLKYSYVCQKCLRKIMPQKKVTSIPSKISDPETKTNVSPATSPPDLNSPESP